MLQKLKTKQFWISFVGIVIMLLQLFGVKVDVPYVNEVVNSICAVLILIGLLDPGQSAPSENDSVEDEIDDKTQCSTKNDSENDKLNS